MLPSTSLSNDPSLPQPLRQQSLSNRIIDLVRARVVQILPLQIHLRPFAVTRVVAREPLREVEWALATHIVPQNLRKLILRKTKTLSVLGDTILKVQRNTKWGLGIEMRERREPENVRRKRRSGTRIRVR